MNGTITHSFKHNNLFRLRRKFTSSVALFEIPAIEYTENGSQLNPLHMLINPANLRGLTLTQTKVAHALLLKTHVLYSNIYAANNLLDSYSESSRMDCAFKLFDEIPLRNLVTWNLMIQGCNKNFLFDDAWRVFFRIHNMGLVMDEFTYGSVLSACGALEHVARGEQVYGLVMKNGFFLNGYVRAGMIDLFTKSSRVEDALKVLYDVQCENVVTWNAVVSGAVKNNDNLVALGIFSQMCRHSSLSPNAFTFSSVLTACAAVHELELGKSIHGRVIKCGNEADIFVGTSIVDLYAKSESMCDAVKQFKLMPMRNVVSWTAVISGFVQKGDSASAVRVLNDMQKMGEEINNFTVSSVLAACANPSMFGEALQIHCWIVKIGLYLDPVVKTSLINMYSKIGDINSSELAFFESRDLKQVGIWANMISAFAQNEVYEKAIVLFQRMLKEGIKPDKFIASSILSIIDSLTLGRQVHGYILKVGLVSDVSVGSSVLTMYSKCGNLEESLKSFEQLERKDKVSWTSMIAGFAEHGHADKAIQLFSEMRFEEFVPDEMILIAVLTACSVLPSLKLGRELHGFALRCGFSERTVIGGAVVNMYTKCGDLNSANIVFQKIPLKDKVSWSSLVSGFAQRGHIEEAFHLFEEMLLSDISVDAFTLSSLIRALAISNKPTVGTHLHAHIIKTGLESEPSIGSCLVMMYSKCGSIDDCDKVFQGIRNRDLVSWTTIIASYAHHGKGSDALHIFDLMKKSGIEPDDVTFVGVLSACSYAGLVEEGYIHLSSMFKDYGIHPGYKHYTCMVDLLGRAGRIEEAERFILNMPIEPDSSVWETLLAACKVHGNHELGKVAAEKIMELQPSDAGVFISLSNLCADAGEWEHVMKIRGSMEESGVRKEPGWSSV
ncbi:hypothetical protein BUALT_Bualt07G0061600 [Buddleja alternifolia]|uniref:Pentatricopeptide repeat-containing protein n=1 Tax=Buddleja alternifolia TaxID=168488 RepID=A0AAV6XF68_9LAMI|nr:hypothetical protein BUALT_Bualt07G0061600 [Buddleja alternifolia]